MIDFSYLSVLFVIKIFFMNSKGFTKNMDDTYQKMVDIRERAKAENRAVTYEELELMKGYLQTIKTLRQNFQLEAAQAIKVGGGDGIEDFRLNRQTNALGLTIRQMVGLDMDIENRAIVSSGSALIQNPNVVDDIVYALQSSNPLVDAGVQFVNVENNRQVPKVTAYPAANWVTESSTLGATDPTIGSIKWELKDIAVLVKVKNNVLYDAKADVQRLVSEVTQRAINDAILKAMFYGANGSNQPEGIDNFTDALKVDMGTNGAALQNYNPFISATRKLMDVNIVKKNISFIYNPSIAETIAGFVDTTSQPLNAPKMIADLRHLETTAVKSDYTQGSATDTTRVYAGDFSKMVVGLGGSFSITLDQRYADELTTGFIVHTRIDMKPLFENAFCIIEGITA